MESTLVLVSRIETLPRAFGSLCGRLQLLAGELKDMRKNIARLLTAHMGDPDLCRAPPQHMEFLSEMMYAFAGVIARFKEKAPEDKGAAITETEYMVTRGCHV
eukprot:567937-Prorocentrum_minimum.AAC.2